jgi:starch phosphorylase
MYQHPVQRWAGKVSCSSSSYFGRTHATQQCSNLAAREMRCWELRLRRHWSDLRIGEKTVSRDGDTWFFSVPIDLGGIAPQDVAVQLCSEPRIGGAPFVGQLSCTRSNAGTYSGSAPASRLAEEYTVRIIPRCTGAAVPAELPLILWQN